jgi:hypothetical protein
MEADHLVRLFLLPGALLRGDRWPYTMVKRFLRNLLHKKVKKREATIADFTQMDTTVEGGDFFDCEAVLIADGNVVGETAIITEDKRLQATGGPLPPP